MTQVGCSSVYCILLAYKPALPNTFSLPVSCSLVVVAFYLWESLSAQKPAYFSLVITRKNNLGANHKSVAALWLWWTPHNELKEIWVDMAPGWCCLPYITLIAEGFQVEAMQHNALQPAGRGFLLQSLSTSLLKGQCVNPTGISVLTAQRWHHWVCYH